MMLQAPPPIPKILTFIGAGVFNVVFFAWPYSYGVAILISYAPWRFKKQVHHVFSAIGWHHMLSLPEERTLAD